MQILDRDGARLWNEWSEQADTHVTTTIDLAADLVLQDSSVIDRLIDAVFDQLRHGTITLRVRPRAHSTTRAGSPQRPVHGQSTLA
jgi:hypothetical protein